MKGLKIIHISLLLPLRIDCINNSAILNSGLQNDKNSKISIGNSMIVVIFGINTMSDISKLLYVISRAVRRVKFEAILKYHEIINIKYIFLVNPDH